MRIVGDTRAPGCRAMPSWPPHPLAFSVPCQERGRLKFRPLLLLLGRATSMHLNNSYSIIAKHDRFVMVVDGTGQD